MQTHTDQIWCSMPLEINIVKDFNQLLTNRGFIPGPVNSDKNYGYPESYERDIETITYRFVDSIFLDHPELWEQGTIITDTIPLQDIGNRLISVLPEFWHIWHFNPNYIERDPIRAYNCFMNRVSGERSIVFYELLQRGIIDQGIVSYNCFRPGDREDHSQTNYNWQYSSAELDRYEEQHNFGRTLIPYNTIIDTLEQSIIDSRISLVLETYIADNHIVFSEKLFRVLQMPRPWILYCSPQSVWHLRKYGFDLLDDYVDHSYDNIAPHFSRLTEILNLLQQLMNQEYTDKDYARFQQAAEHNRNLLIEFKNKWPDRLQTVKSQL